MKTKPNYYFNYYHRATVYKKMSRLDLAVQHLTKVISLSSKHSNAYNYRGIIYIELNEPNKACNDFKKAVELGNKQGEINLK
ncbi:tetratricopeptide repeat protein [Wenyingzhuangia sp. 1_MG-2023]|nr:tetratricopeptide repeat protein [Wenyingzhuangia sp. 1_MG-2023]